MRNALIQSKRNKMTITKTIFETSPINNTLSKGQARISGIIRKGIDEEKSLLVCMPEHTMHVLHAEIRNLP